MKKTALFLFSIIAFMLVIILSWYLVFTRSNGIKLNTNGAAVIKEIRSLQRLETASFTIEKIIDGVNIFLIERDCNNTFDIDLIKKKNSKDKDLAIILMKDGTLYNPIYHIEKNKRIGVFDMKHHIIQKMLTQI
jgi:hypothetical protein